MINKCKLIDRLFSKSNKLPVKELDILIKTYNRLLSKTPTKL